VAETLLPFWRRQMRTENCSDIPYCVAVATAKKHPPRAALFESRERRRN
jgi:hypothetical protein